MGGLTRFLRRTYFPTAFLIVFVLIVFDASVPPVVGQIMTVTVTQTVRAVTVTVTQRVQVTVERTVTFTVATAMPTTSVVTRVLTETSLVNKLMTETLFMSRLTETSVGYALIAETGTPAADRSGAEPPYLPAYGGYTVVTLVGFIGGILASGIFRRREKSKTRAKK